MLHNLRAKVARKWKKIGKHAHSFPPPSFPPCMRVTRCVMVSMHLKEYTLATFAVDDSHNTSLYNLAMFAAADSPDTSLYCTLLPYSS
ncbi:hypothetical protein CEXT_122031 [Caerostris extrusa]|uniref:Uncharacterized protein n=1 Tax=Caerostris extrusa TaxID=172846 RepID=A0AAV4VZ58_CAEEX|nr:hypothetical protein CEXT_122031 [Caerostris extrusa]